MGLTGDDDGGGDFAPRGALSAAVSREARVLVGSLFDPDVVEWGLVSHEKNLAVRLHRRAWARRGCVPRAKMAIQPAALQREELAVGALLKRFAGWLLGRCGCWRASRCG